MDAFAGAVRALFADPHLAVDAVWRAGGTGAPVALRIVRRSGDRMAAFGDGRFVVDGLAVDVALADVATLAEGDTFAVGAETLIVDGAPVRDALRLVWTAQVRPQ